MKHRMTDPYFIPAPDGWFPLAMAALEREHLHVLHEPTAPRTIQTFSERHLQCIWADARLRPLNLRTADGENVHVEHPGEWNHGPGPDFQNARLKIGDNERRVSGDIEIHIRARDWLQHHHTHDPRYQNICAHITWHPDTLPPAELPPGALQIALAPILSANPTFSFDSIDLMAYPAAAKAPMPPCQSELKKLSPDQREHILDTAGELRLLTRTQHLAHQILKHDAAQILYQETLAALGYRHNSILLRKMAGMLPLDKLRTLSKGDMTTAYAILLGFSGLLPDPSTATVKTYDAATKTVLRTLWDIYWKLADALPSPGISKADWNLTGIRPANRPERRLMAAAALFAPRKALPDYLEKAVHTNVSPMDSLEKALQTLLDSENIPYWPTRLSYHSAPLQQPQALVGDSRQRAILLNVWLPMLATCGKPAHHYAQWMPKLPAEESNHTIRTMAKRLFGEDHTPALYRSALRRQGLIHLHHTHCLPDHSLCETCTLPTFIRNHTSLS